MIWDHVRFGNRSEGTGAFVGDCNFLSSDLQLADCSAYSPQTGFRLTLTHQGWPHALCVVAMPDRTRCPIRKLLGLHGQVRLDCLIVQRILAEKHKSLRTTKFEA
jgi:hypothetical protein